MNNQTCVFHSGPLMDIEHGGHGVSGYVEM